jgi:hypothetical protein
VHKAAVVALDQLQIFGFWNGRSRADMPGTLFLRDTHQTYTIHRGGGAKILGKDVRNGFWTTVLSPVTCESLGTEQETA